MTKRANGEGTICKRAYGRWVGAVTLGIDRTTGKAIRKFIYGKTQKDVMNKISALKSEVAAGEYVKPSDMTVELWLNIWLDTYCVHLKPLTLSSYKTIIEKHILSELNNVPLQALNTYDIQAFINNLTVSPKTIKNIYGVLNKALNKAAELMYIKKNPCGAVSLPKVAKPKIRALSDEEIKALFKELKNTRYYDFCKLALYTGLRRGELLGLTWDCYKREDGYLYVYRQLQIINGEYAFITPKGGKSRTVALPSVAIELIDGLKANDESEFIFHNEIGEHFSISNIGTVFRECVKKSGIENATLHDLRHTYAVNALRAGDNFKSVQNNLGHATPAFTLDRYATVTYDMLKETQNKLQGFFRTLDI